MSEDIWDSLATIPDAVSPTEEQQAELERRLEASSSRSGERHFVVRPEDKIAKAGVTRQILVRPEAEAEVRQAFDIGNIGSLKILFKRRRGRFL